MQRVRSEPSWNRQVHQPLLNLACEGGDGISILDVSYQLATAAHPYRVRAGDVSSATLTGDCIPRLRTEAPDDASVLGTSVTTSSSIATSSDASRGHHGDADVFRDGHTHRRFGSKKVDYALVILPAPGTPLQAAVQRVLNALGYQALAAADASPHAVAIHQSDIIRTATEESYGCCHRDEDGHRVERPLDSAGLHDRRAP